MTGGAGNKIVLMSKNNEELPPPIEQSSIKEDQTILAPRNLQMVMLDNLSLDNYNHYSIAPPIKQPSRNIVKPPKEI